MNIAFNLRNRERGLQRCIKSRYETLQSSDRLGDRYSDSPVWHDCVEELLEDVFALVEGEDVAEVGWVGAELPKVVLHHLHRRVHVQLATPQQLHVEVGVILMRN